jgi:excisionase family DNA binding protein
MTSRDALRALVDASPADAVLSVPATWLVELLADRPAPGRGEPAAAAVDHTVQQVADQFNRGASTIRTWCETGALPGAYRFNGREWRIPASAIDAMQREQAKRHATPRTASRPARPADVSSWRKHLPNPAGRGE